MFFKQIICLLPIAILFNVLESESARPNSCKRYIDYFFVDFSKNCYYNPDIFSTNTQILARHVGTYETHTVSTEDGYILTIFRIPKKNPKGVVILQHPVTTDSIIFLTQNNQSLAFLMANQGYDVWLPNNRGTVYSDKHVNLTTSDFAYWNFSFHEIGLYDYSSIIRYIKEKTGRSDLIFIGHSMSATASLIYASLKPTEAKNSIKVFIEMATPAYLKNVRSPVRFMAPFRPAIEAIANFLQIGSLFTKGSLEDYLTKLTIYIPFKKVIVIMEAITSGWTPNGFDPELINLEFPQKSPRSFSTKIFFHYAQIVNSDGKFQMYDNGKKKNMISYGSTTPPEYPVEKINVPIYLITSSSDSLATVKDSEILYNKLSDEARSYGKLEVSGINHIDFFFGKDRINKVYDKIFSLLHKIL